MDINLKSNEKKDNKILTSLIIILILFIASVGMFKTYTFISKLAKNTQGNFFDEYDFATALTELSYVLDYNIEQQSTEESIEPKDIFINESNLKYLLGESGISNVEDVYIDFNKSFDRWDSNLKSNYKNLNYFALSKENGEVKTNIKDEIKVTDDRKIDLSSFDIDKYIS